ncbi:MAG: hypothetical protein AABW87_01795 [Nanoarchaeota archaeon]
MSLEAIEQNIRSILEIIDSGSGSVEDKKENILRRASTIRKLIQEEVNEMRRSDNGRG